jgi:hypothetical protein
LQAFEHRQLYDAGAWDQRGLLLDLANGRVPLAVIDYLGNWLTPEMIAMITHRYGQDGSRGTYDLYRPLDLGARTALDARFPDGLQLTAYYLAPGRQVYHAGELTPLTLEWRRASNDPPAGRYEVVVQLRDAAGRTTAEAVQPLLYGALAPRDWPVSDVVQHVQPLPLPLDLAAGTYQLAVTLRRDGNDLAAPVILGPLVVEAQNGRAWGRFGYYVPPPLLSAWARFGGDALLGAPQMPAMPLGGATVQCFERGCLRLQGDSAERVPLGELVALGEAGLTPSETISASFREAYDSYGGEAALGPPISGEIARRGKLVQYTRYARLERPLSGGPVQLGALGADYLRLPNGGPYRWP